MGRHKLTIEDAQNLAEKKNGKCLSSVYVHSLCDLIWQCDDNHTWNAPYKNIKHGSWCQACYSKRRPFVKLYTRAKFIDKAKKKHFDMDYDYSLVVYKGAHIKVDIICKKHGIFSQKPGNHLFGQKCYDCAKEISDANLTFTNDIIDDLLIKNNINVKRLDDYLNSKNQVSWQCLKCCNIFKSIAHSVINSIRTCSKCSGYKVTNLEIDNFLIENNVKIKRLGDYINNYTKIFWECLKCSNIWDAQPVEIKRKRNNGSGCPKCSRHKNEKLVYDFLKTHNFIFDYQKCLFISNSSKQKRIFPDFYIPSLNLVIEYNGQQHYIPTTFHASMTYDDTVISLQNQIERDNRLKQYCTDNNINFLEIDGRKFKGKDLLKFLEEYFNINTESDK